MLEIRGYKEDEIQQIKDILNKEKINDLKINSDLILIVSEDNAVLGLCSVEIKNSEYWLKHLIIKEDSRGQELGDGLLRTMLNKLDLQGIKSLYYKDIDSYLVEKGFIKNEKGFLELNISDFFTNGCTCSGNAYEV